MKKRLMTSLLFLGVMFGIIGCGEKEKEPVSLTWSVFSDCEDSFSKEWQDGFNALLKEKGICAEVQFQAVSVDWQAAGEESFGTICRNGFAGQTKQSDILTDFGRTEDVWCYPDYIRNGIYEDLTPFMETADGKKLKEAYPEAIWETVRYERKIYGIPSFGELTFSEYFVMKKTMAEALGISDKTELPKSEILALAEVYSEKNGRVYKIQYGSLTAPEGYEVIPGASWFLAGKMNGNYEVSLRLDNPAYLQMLKEYQSYHEKGIWDGISLTDPNLFGYSVGSYSAETAMQAASAEMGLDPDQYQVFHVEDYPLFLSGNTTGIHRSSEHQEEAFQVLAAAFSDEELVNYLVYGREGIEYHLENGKAVVDRGITESGGVTTKSMSNHILCLPSERETEQKREILMAYYDTLPKSIFLDRWIDTAPVQEETAKLQKAYGYEEWQDGLTDDLERDIQEVRERISSTETEAIRKLLESQLNEQEETWEDGNK